MPKSRHPLINTRSAPEAKAGNCLLSGSAGRGCDLKVRDRGQSGRLADTCHRSGTDYCTTGFGQRTKPLAR